MAKSWKEILEQNKVLPASAKITQDATDKKTEEFKNDVETFDSKNTLDKDLTVVGSKSKTKINSSETVVKEDIDDVRLVHKEEAFDLYDEIADLLENLAFSSPYNSAFINLTSHLRSVRDYILSSTPREDATDSPVTDETSIVESVVEKATAGSKMTKKEKGLSMVRNKFKGDASVKVEEGYKAGSLKLKDGSTVKLSKDDAKNLNTMLTSTSAKEDMSEDVTKSKKSFEEILTFARSIVEGDMGVANPATDEDVSKETKKKEPKENETNN